MEISRESAELKKYKSHLYKTDQNNVVYHTGHNVLCAGTFTSAHELTIHSTISFSSASNSKQARPLLSLVTLCHTYTRSPRGPNYLINHKFLNPAPADTISVTAYHFLTRKKRATPAGFRAFSHSPQQHKGQEKKKKETTLLALFLSILSSSSILFAQFWWLLLSSFLPSTKAQLVLQTVVWCRDTGA